MPSPTLVPLEALLESLPEAFVVVERSGRITTLNRPAETLLGRERADLTGKSMASFTATWPPTATATWTRLDAWRRDDTNLPVEVRWIVLDVEPVPLVVGRLRSAATAAREPRDATARMGGAPDAPDPTALLKDEFLATIAHELRTPLQSMLGWTQILRSTKQKPETTARALEVIERNIRRQASAIEGLIELAEILTGPLRLDVRSVRAMPILDAALARVAESARARGVGLGEHYEADDVRVVADPERLEHVLWKLLSNAIRFTPEGGRVELRSRVAGDLTELTVRDTGQGIHPDALPRIFESIRKVDESLRQRERPGLRLSTVRQLMEMQGGTVRAESAGLGHGASFTVSLRLVRTARGPT